MSEKLTSEEVTYTNITISKLLIIPVQLRSLSPPPIVSLSTIIISKKNEGLSS